MRRDDVTCCVRTASVPERNLGHIESANSLKDPVASLGYL
jgi:hypothetical protein